MVLMSGTRMAHRLPSRSMARMIMGLWSVLDSSRTVWLNIYSAYTLNVSLWDDAIVVRHYRTGNMIDYILELPAHF